MSQQLALHLGTPPTTIFIGSLAPPLHFLEVWSATKFYNVNDVVTNAAGTTFYRALIPNQNVAVTTASTWAQLAVGGYVGAGTSFAVPPQPGTSRRATATPIAWEIITTCTALTIFLQGSIDGSNWFNLDEYVTAAGGNALQIVTNNPVNFLRANVTASDSGTTVVQVQL